MPTRERPQFGTRFRFKTLNVMIYDRGIEQNVDNNNLDEYEKKCKRERERNKLGTK